MAVMTTRIITFLVGNPEQSLHFLHFPLASLEGGSHPIYHVFTDTIFLTSRISSPLFPLIISGFIQSGFNTSSPRFGEEVKSNLTMFSTGYENKPPWKNDVRLSVFFFSSHVNDTDPTEKKMKERNLQFWIEFQHVSARVSLVKWFFPGDP